MLFKLAAIIVIACCGCRTTHSATSETHLSEATEARSEGGTVVTTTTTKGPETVITVTEEFAPAPPPLRSGPDGQSQSTSSGRAPVNQKGWQSQASEPDASDNLSPHGSLIKRTTVTDTKGPSLSESHLNARASTETRVETKADAKAQSASASSPSASCAFGGMLWALAVVGLALVLFAAVRKRMF